MKAQTIALILMALAWAAMTVCGPNSPINVPTGPQGPAATLIGTWKDSSPVVLHTGPQTATQTNCGMGDFYSAQWLFSFIIVPGTDDHHVKVGLHLTDGKVLTDPEHACDGANPPIYDSTTTAGDTFDGTITGTTLVLKFGGEVPAGTCTFTSSVMTCTYDYNNQGGGHETTTPTEITLNKQP